MESNDLVSRLGETEAVFRPSPGQTFVGTFLAAVAAVALFAVAIFGCGFDVTNRICGALVGFGALALARWIFRLRKWRVAMFSNGLVQVLPGGVQELLWADVREVIETRLKAFNEPTIRVSVVARGTRMVVSPINYRSRARLFRTLIEAATKRGIPVRVEWEESD